MSKYNTYQQVFGLSLASNCIGNKKDTEANLQTLVEEMLPSYIALLGGDWTIVWGPKVWKYDPQTSDTGPDNVWYVAYNPAVVFEDGVTREAYVVAIAGSGPIYDYAVEDFEVVSVVDFTGWISQWVGGVPTLPAKAENVGQGTYTAWGTTNAVYTLLHEQSPPSASSPGLTLPQFFAALNGGTGPSPTCKVIFAGHSLGGALSPTLALAFVQSGLLSPSVTLVYPTAGPSPGNKSFAQLYASKFPKVGGSGYQTWNCNIVNTIDIVPQAWCTSASISPEENLTNIPTIYGTPSQPLLSKLQVAVRLVSAVVNRSNIVYYPIQYSRFEGTPPPTPPTTFDEFLVTDASHQHVNSYEEYIGVQPPPSLTRAMRAGIDLAAEEGLRIYAVLYTLMKAGGLDVQDGKVGKVAQAAEHLKRREE